MNRKRRTEILIKGSMDVARKLVKEIDQRYRVIVIEEPNNGLAMIKIQEGAKKSVFYVGEILVTEAKVQINGNLGIGIVSGNKGELAYLLAVIDAAYNAGLGEIEDWDDRLIEEEIKIKEVEEKNIAKILTTKVNFETMEV